MYQEIPRANLVCTYQLCAAHQLYRKHWNPEKNKRVYGKCTQIHGHQYQVDLVIGGEISSETGMVINAFDVDEIVKPFFQENLDHKFLNEDVAFFQDKPPTAEWISVWIYNELKNKFPSQNSLLKVRVSETPKLAVEYPS